jgi:hypothetical protein
MDIIKFFNISNPSRYTMALGFTQHLVEMSTRDLPGGVKRGWHLRLTTSPPSMNRFCRKFGILDVSKPYRPQWPAYLLLF